MTEIRPFTAADVGPAAELLAQRQQHLRRSVPTLPAGFETPAPAARAVRGALARSSAGAAAWRAGRCLGFVLFGLRRNEAWGRHGWCEAAGHACAPGETDALFELYAATGAALVDAGVTHHAVLAPAGDPEALAAWWELGFAKQQAHGARPLPGPRGAGAASEPTGSAPAGRVRRARAGDAEALASLAELIVRHQAGAPTWAPRLPGDGAALRVSYAGLATDPTAAAFLAWRGAEAVGVAAFFGAGGGADDPLLPDAACELKVASTTPSARGAGVASALVAHGLRAMTRLGCRACVADWRTANREAARFWPRRGFVEVGFRLVRRVERGSEGPADDAGDR